MKITKNFWILVLLMFFSSNKIFAQVWEVCPSCPISSIKQAVAKASDFDTIIVQKGVYKEYNIQITKPLSIFGKDNPVVDGQDSGEIFTIQANNVTLDGFHIINVGTSYTTDFAAVRVVKSENFLLQNLKLERLFFGIYLEKSNNGKVFNNEIRGDAVEEFNSGNGIHLWYCKNVKIRDNRTQQVRDGIYLEFSENIEITRNISLNNVRYGLHFMFSDNCMYRENVFDNNGAGVAVMFSKFIEMQHNTFRKNWGTASYGLLLKEINDSKINGNLFEDNTIGINVEGSNRIDYTNNDFKGNGWAIKIRGACYENQFLNNNFLYNSFDVAYNSEVDSNVFLKNYWSNYTGYDLNNNGFGDIPYRPVKLFSYIVNRSPQAITLLRSLFIDIIDFSEKVSPIFTPDNLTDEQPRMKPIKNDRN